jgi:hypothetical protein
MGHQAAFLLAASFRKDVTVTSFAFLEVLLFAFTLSLFGHEELRGWGPRNT